MVGIQLIGKDAVLQAFDKLADDSDVWELFQAKQMIIQGTGSESLGDWLDMFYQSGSHAIYTLRICDNQGSYTASLNFRLQDIYGGAGINGYSTKLEQRIAELEKQKTDDGDREESFGDLIYGLFKDPEKLDTLIGAFTRFRNNNNTQTVMNGSNLTAGNSDQESRLDRLEQVLDSLERKNPKLLEHLEKLNALDTATFSVVMSKIDAL